MAFIEANVFDLLVDATNRIGVSTLAETGVLAAAALKAAAG